MWFIEEELGSPSPVISITGPSDGLAGLKAFSSKIFKKVVRKKTYLKTGKYFEK